MAPKGPPDPGVTRDKGDLPPEVDMDKLTIREKDNELIVEATPKWVARLARCPSPLLSTYPYLPLAVGRPCP